MDPHRVRAGGTVNTDRIRALRDEGALAERYLELGPLLAAADTATVRRAGALLGGLSCQDVVAANPGIPTIAISVTGSGTIAPLLPALTGELARHGLAGQVSVGDPGAYALHLARPAAADLTLCLLDASAVFDRIVSPVWTVDDVGTAAAELLGLLRGFAASHTERGRGALVLTTAPLWSSWTNQVLDLRERARLGAVWRRFTADLLELGTSADTVYVIDLDPLLGDLGPARDARLEGYAHVAYTDALLGALARQVGHLARGLCGRPRKCLVLDLDGTLWGGTLAESGGDGLDMAEGFRGEAHRRFQRAVAQLGSQGVLLAVCSKNDAAEVDQVLRTHPDLLVRRDDFVTVLAGWEPKVATVPRVAERIGIGVDSLVFVDDSTTETGLIRANRPEIAVVDVDADEPATHVDRLLAEGWFDATTITAEDRERAEAYRTEARRADFRTGFSSLTDYLAELDTRLDIFAPGPADVARLAQLTQRTNQFNLMTLRLDESAVRAALSDADSVVAPIRVRDRFGDHGVVGVVFARRDGGTVLIDNLVMSCRVLGRGIESAWIGELLRWAAAQGASAVIGGYKPTPRNGRVENLLPEHGFAPIDTPAGFDPAARWFRHDLAELPGPVANLTVESALPAPAGGTR
ncbi:methoxymalonyl-ACP biosynthesis protein FkbH [Prauserella sp. PE36]|nr:methoxymalonyl-ACP biosynthesis protein FkbH [Prauserella sp. PE36]